MHAEDSLVSAARPVGAVKSQNAGWGQLRRHTGPGTYSPLSFLRHHHPKNVIYARGITGAVLLETFKYVGIPSARPPISLEDAGTGRVAFR
jgi:hypothetical protein